MTTTPLGDFALAGAAAWDAFEPLLDEDALTAIARAAKVLIALEADPGTLETAIALAVIDHRGDYRCVARVPAVQIGSAIC